MRTRSVWGTRAIHVVRTLAGRVILTFALALRQWWWIAVALVVSYGLAWFSHFFVEHNRPASFEHPKSRDRWTLVDLLLWTPVVLGAIAGGVYLLGHLIFRI